MHFEKEYFEDFKYPQRENLIKRHVLEVLKWGAKVSDRDLLNGQGKTALDVGCAYGFAVDVLKSLGYDSLGVDISRYSIKQAKKKIRIVDFAVCDMQSGLPFKKESFDLVTCFEVIEHLANPLRAIKNISSICKNTMIYTTPNKLVEKPVKKIVRDLDKTHVNVKTPREWEKYLRENLQFGFIKVEPFFDTNLRVKNKLLFFKSFKIPHYGLDARIIIKKNSTNNAKNTFKISPKKK